MKYGAADQRTPLAQNGMNCTRPLIRRWWAALGHNPPNTFRVGDFRFTLLS